MTGECERTQWNYKKQKEKSIIYKNLLTFETKSVIMLLPHQILYLFVRSILLGGVMLFCFNFIILAICKIWCGNLAKRQSLQASFSFGSDVFYLSKILLLLSALTL